MDLLIGILMIHAVPHLILGLWNRQFYSPLGKSSTANLFYGVIVALLAAGLFLKNYGLDGLMENGIFLGGFVAIVLYAVFGKLIYQHQKKNKMQHG